MRLRFGSLRRWKSTRCTFAKLAMYAHFVYGGHRLGALQDLLVLVAHVVSFGLLGVFGRNGGSAAKPTWSVGTPSLDTVA
jgi:hypothetical protein